MTHPDPKALALERFAQPHAEGIEVIGRCATDPPLTVRTLLDAIGERAQAGSRVAELGFGSGWLLEAMLDTLPDASLFGVDLSHATVERGRRLYGDRVRFVVGDMERLPFHSGAFNVIVTCWTLYFARDVDTVLEEIKRCLRPGGRLIAATSAPDHEQEFVELVEQAARSVLGRELHEPDIGRRFDLETGGDPLRRHFPTVAVREWHGEMVVHDLSDMLALWPKWQPAGIDAQEMERVRGAFERLVSERLKRQGSLRARRHECAFVCDLEPPASSL